MSFKFLGRLAGAVVACCLLNGCPSPFHLVLFNDTDDTVVVRRRSQDRAPLVIFAEISGEITGVSTDDFTITRKGKVLHYRLPIPYTYPSFPELRKYERNVPPLGRAFCFQLAQDNRIYILQRREKLVARDHPAQPPGFPLVPH